METSEKQLYFNEINKSATRDLISEAREDGRKKGKIEGKQELWDDIKEVSSIDPEEIEWIKQKHGLK